MRRIRRKSIPMVDRPRRLKKGEGHCKNGNTKEVIYIPAQGSRCTRQTDTVEGEVTC